MGRTFTITQLLLMGRQACDMQNSTLVGDPELQIELNSLYGELHALAVHGGFRIFESTQTVATDGVNDAFALNADFNGLLGVDWLDGTSYRALYEETFEERNTYTTDVGSRAYSYYIKGNNPANIVLRPKPPNSQTYRVTYVPLPVDLSVAAGATAVDVIWAGPGEDFLRWGMARYCLGKEESDTTHAMMNWERSKQRIEEVREDRAMTARRSNRIFGPLDDSGEPNDPANWRR
jgi:hypothetical protein